MKNTEGYKKVHGLYIGYNMARIGGYSYTDEDGHKGFADFVDHKDIFRLAKKYNIKTIHLAGDWSRLGVIGVEGWGQEVSLNSAKRYSHRLEMFSRYGRI